MMMSPCNAQHYEFLATTYDQHWTHSGTFVDWMTRKIMESLALRPHHRIIDVGCGTGLYSRRIVDLVRPENCILCVDPSAAMLGRLGSTAGVRPVLASAEQLGGELPDFAPLNISPGSFDAVLVKEAIHHVAPSDRAPTVGGLGNLLAQGGRLLIVMLPTRIRYPLFTAALEMFEELQPDPEEIIGHVRRAGLLARIEYHEFALTIPKDRYLAMVRGRYMSLLSAFDEGEIEAGIREIDAIHPEQLLSFPDRFAFILGTRLAPTR
ncbi:class I SAM-dependent methyltransferase [Frankia sp. AgKG'84/4]|uniref:class I SAM-dependent methyltransferase n=1 Tax=Frankia sp. AgKG'84/4 TaxID=573490 RepID=UPI00200C5A7B|nr:class I SAM-dependent methyltransferase [Frankia sp. AgKG'84/4]MCL9796024.1 class I SAM-dependent methyltransferase [Frankia sp. AgKG'84/4]